MSQSLPGYETGRSVAPRDVLLSHEGTIQVPIIVDGTVGTDGANTNYPYEIRAGWLMGRGTATGRWVPCKRTTVTAGGGATSDDVPVIDAAAFQMGDVVTVGANADLTVTAVDSATHTITVSSSITFANSAAVFAQDGSQTCRGVLLDFVRLRNADNTAAANKSAGLLIQGAVQSTLLLGDVAAIRADTAAVLAGIRFSDDYGL